MGEFFALAAAVVWGFAVILFKRSGESVAPFALNFFRVGVSSVVFLLLLVVLRMPLGGQAPLGDILLLAASGVLGIALSDTLFHRSLNIIGAGITAIVDCLYSPFIVLFAFLLLRERIGPQQTIGMGLVISGVLLTTRIHPPPDTSRRRLLAGIGWGVGAMATVALGIVIAKPRAGAHARALGDLGSPARGPGGDAALGPPQPAATPHLRRLPARADLALQPDRHLARLLPRAAVLDSRHEVRQGGNGGDPQPDRHHLRALLRHDLPA